MAGIDSFVVFGSHFDGADGATTATDFATNQAAKTINFVGNAQIDTAQSKFGGASCLFDGTGDSLAIADSDDWNFGTGDWTVDLWIRRAVTSSDQIAFEVGNAASDGIRFNVERGTGAQDLQINGTTSNIGGTAFNIDQWYHIEINRSGTTVNYFIDGVAQTGTTSSADITSGTAGLTIGNDDSAGGIAYNGWIDEVRVSKGIARHTSNFTPEIVAYSGAGGSFASNMMLMGVC